MKVLVIYDTCGEDTPICYVATGEAATMAIAADGQYMNSNNEESLNAFFDKYLYDAEGEPIPNTNEFKEITNFNQKFEFDRIINIGFAP